MLRLPASNPTISPSSSDATVNADGRTQALAAGAVLGLLRAYKILLSPLFTGSCRFHPSCADYMTEAVRLHGAAHGTWLGLRRLVRCRPFGGYGIDPVPRS
jgi:putative membrane protein insertion efficiency factor